MVQKIVHPIFNNFDDIKIHLTNIASICFGRECSNNYKNTFDRLKREQNGEPTSSFEFAYVSSGISAPPKLRGSKYVHYIDSGIIFNAVFNIRELYKHYKEDTEKILDKYMCYDNSKFVSNNISIFKITCSIPASIHIMRHRLFSFQGLSRRYTKPSSVKFDFNGVISNRYKKIVLDEYDRLIKKGYHTQYARLVLPLALQTTFYMCGTNNQFRDFCKVRTSMATQEETRIIAKEIECLL